MIPLCLAIPYSPLGPADARNQVGLTNLWNHMHRLRVAWRGGSRWRWVIGSPKGKGDERKLYKKSWPVLIARVLVGHGMVGVGAIRCYPFCHVAIVYQLLNQQLLQLFITQQHINSFLSFQRLFALIVRYVLIVLCMCWRFLSPLRELLTAWSKRKKQVLVCMCDQIWNSFSI